jgi:hypothetical protein
MLSERASKRDQSPSVSCGEFGASIAFINCRERWAANVFSAEG